MARTPITLNTGSGPYPVLPVVALSADLTMQVLSGAAGANGNQAAFGNFNRLLMIFQNTDATAKTVLISSVASLLNRTGDLGAYTLAAGFVSAFLIERAGFIQADGNVYFESNSALMKCAIIGVQ